MLVLVGGIVGAVLCAGIGRIGHNALVAPTIGFASGVALSWGALDSWVHPTVLCATVGALVFVIIGDSVSHGGGALAFFTMTGLFGATLGLPFGFLKLEYRAPICAVPIGFTMLIALYSLQFPPQAMKLMRMIESAHHPPAILLVYLAVCAIAGSAIAKCVKKLSKDR